MADLPEYSLAEAGVSLTQSPVHTPEGGVLTAQNVEKIRIQGLGGLGSRGGLAPLAGMTALGAPIVALANLPFSLQKSPIMLVGLNSADADSWLSTPDGSVFTNIPAATLQRAYSAQQYASLGSFFVPGNFWIGRRPCMFKNKFFFAGDDYTLGTTQPVLVVYNDTGGQFEILRIPDNPTASGVTQGIMDSWVDNGVIYLATFDPGGTGAPNVKGRVIAFDPNAGSLSVVGNYFGSDAGENANGMPYAMTSFLGRLFVGTNGLAGTNNMAVYSILPGIETAWTLEHQFSASDGWAMSMIVFNGNLYIATQNAIANIWKWTPGGTRSKVYLGSHATESYMSGLIEFNGSLFACYFCETLDVLVVSSPDGVTWGTDKDIGAVIGKSFAPGVPFVFNGDLFWPFYDATGSHVSDFLYKRTPGGVWTQAVTARGMGGVVGQYIPS